MFVSRNLLLTLIAALLLVTLLVWWAGGLRSVLSSTHQQRLPEQTSLAPGVESDNMAATVSPSDAEPGGEDGALSPLPAEGGAPATDAEPAEDDTLTATVAEVPQELALLLGTIMKEVSAGNYDHAALIALDAEELSREYPQVQLLLYYSIARNYEKMGFVDMAIEQYLKALAIDPGHDLSYKALRRLDPGFEVVHQESTSLAKEVSAPSRR